MDRQFRQVLVYYELNEGLDLVAFCILHGLPAILKLVGSQCCAWLRHCARRVRVSGTPLAGVMNVGAFADAYGGFRKRRNGSGAGTRTPDTRIMIPLL